MCIFGQKEGQNALSAPAAGNGTKRKQNSTFYKFVKQQNMLYIFVKHFCTIFLPCPAAAARGVKKILSA